MAYDRHDNALETRILDHLLELVVDMVPDLVLALIESLPGNFIAAAHEPVSATKHSVVRFRFVPELFDQEVRTAVRALRLKNDIGFVGHGSSPMDDTRIQP
jgi:hypothetical protein